MKQEPLYAHNVVSLRGMESSVIIVEHHLEHSVALTVEQRLLLDLIFVASAVPLWNKAASVRTVVVRMNQA